jgi:lipoprotein-releasing system ATP-binding protein
MNDAVKNGAVVACSGLQKTYQGPAAVPVLLGVELAVQPGEHIAIMGKSGSGKSTLLHLLGGLDAPTAGQVFVQGRELSAMDEAERGRVRNATLGFVYQFHHLLPEFTAVENVAMPLLIRRMERAAALRESRQRAEGSRPRCAARAPAGRALRRRAPALRVCTRAGYRAGVRARRRANRNLDTHTADEVFEAMLRLSASHGTAFVLVTHDASLAARAQRQFELREGVLHPGPLSAT